jgi:DNA end-binding protein Ku
MFEDEEKKRILAAIGAKIEGKKIVAVDHLADAGSAEILDLTQMLMASLGKAQKDTPTRTTKEKTPATAPAVVTSLKDATAQRKGAKRAPKVAEPSTAPTPRARMKR